MTEPVWVSKLPSDPPNIRLESFNGRTLYNGSIEELYILASENAYTENGFEWTPTADHPFLKNVHPEYIVGLNKATTVADLVNLIIDWSNPVAQVIFVQGSVRDRKKVSYEKWYNHNGIVRAICNHSHNSYEYALRDSIPDTWKTDATGLWHPSL